MGLMRLSRRAVEPELMDDAKAGGEELAVAHRDLGRLNRIFSASGPILYGVERIWRQAGCPAELSVLDIGCGMGDVNRALLGWADRRGVRLRLTLSDITEEACAEAARFFAEEPRVSVVRQDLYKLPAGCADIVTASQMLHHMAPDDVPAAALALRRASRLGAVIGDIHRHPIAWLAVWAVTRAVSRNPYIRHDGPLSVAKGFRSEDWRQLRSTPGLEALQASWRPLFRYAVIIPKEPPGAKDRRG